MFFFQTTEWTDKFSYQISSQVLYFCDSRRNTKGKIF